MGTLEEALAGHAFFQGLAPNYLKEIAGCASEVTFEAGQYIFHEGSAADRFYAILQGRVAVEVATPDRGSIVIQTLEAGDVLGWSWLLPPFERHFAARAVELTRAIAIDAACILGKCEVNHDLGYEMLTRFTRLMAGRLQSARLQLLDFYGKTR